MSSTRMAVCLFGRVLSRNSRNLGQLYKNVGVRTFLSPAYSCSDAWKKRQDTELLSKINAAEFAMRLQEKIDRRENISAVDIDILACKLDQLERIQLDYVQNIFHKFRHMPDTVNVKDSTYHGIVRALVQMGEEDRLLEILKDKWNYGVFLDHYLANHLIDHFLKQEQYKEAAEVAFEMMLQEDFNDKLTKTLSWYACHSYWKNLAAYETEEGEQQEEEEEDEEEVLVKVAWIRTPWYDDHWDLATDKHKLGKTFVSLSQGQDDLEGLSYRLVGYGLWQKWDEGIKLLQNVADEKDKKLAQEAVDSFISCLDCVETKETPEEAKDPGLVRMEDVMPYTTAEQKEQHQQHLQDITERLKSQNQIEEIDLGAQLQNKVQQVAQQSESEHISQQRALFDQWNEQRQRLLEKQIEGFRIQKRKIEIADRLKELTEIEERLRYFERKGEISVAKMQAPKMRPIEDVVEEEVFVAAPGERGKGYQEK